MDDIEQLKDMLKMCLEKIDNLETGQAQLRDEMYAKVLNPIAEAEDAQKFNDFKDKYSYELGDYEEPLKKLEGEDFDIYREAYDQSSEIPDEQMDDWVMSYADKISDEIDKFREAFGLSPDDKVEIESKGEGDVQVEVNDKPVDGTATDVGEVSEEVSEEVKEDASEAAPEKAEESIEDKLKVDETEDDGAEDDEAVLEELRKYKNNY